MQDPDLRLVRKAARGNRRALETLYDRYRTRLLGFLVRNLQDRELAEEVYQEAWIKVLNGIGRFESGRGTFRSWLYRVAGNAAVDRLRRETVRRTEELDAPLAPGGATMAERLVSGQPDPARAGEARLMMRELDRALAGLDDRQRNAVLLRHQQGLTYAELARALNVPEGTAKTLVHRGSAKLREQLTRWFDDEA